MSDPDIVEHWEVGSPHGLLWGMHTVFLKPFQPWLPKPRKLHMPLTP